MNQTSTSGISLPTLVFIVLLILKLTGVIAIGWFWVFLPLILVAVFGVIASIITLAMFWFADKLSQ